MRTRTPLPLLVSHRGLTEREGPLGKAWLAPGGGFEPVRPPEPKPDRRTSAMRIYYIDESEGPRRPLRPGRGRRAVERPQRPRPRLAAQAGTTLRRPTGPGASRLRTCWRAGGKLARVGNADRRLSPGHGAEIFVGGLQLVEDAARTIGGVEVVNVCLHKPDARGHERASLDRLLNRINTSVASANRHAFLIFDEGREEMVARLYRRLRSRNPVPSRYEAWEDGERTKDIPIERVIGGPAFRSSHSDHLLQMADLIAHALLKQEEEPSPRVKAPGHRPRLREPRPRPQPQGVQARPPRRRQTVRGSGLVIGVAAP